MKKDWLPSIVPDSGQHMLKNWIQRSMKAHYLSLKLYGNIFWWGVGFRDGTYFRETAWTVSNMCNITSIQCRDVQPSLWLASSKVGVINSVWFLSAPHWTQFILFVSRPVCFGKCNHHQFITILWQDSFWFLVGVGRSSAKKTTMNLNECLSFF